MFCGPESPTFLNIAATLHISWHLRLPSVLALLNRAMTIQEVLQGNLVKNWLTCGFLFVESHLVST